MPQIAKNAEQVNRQTAKKTTAEIIQFPKAQSNGNPVFPAYAMDYWRRGFAIMPLAALSKTSLVSGFNKWGSRPGRAIVEKWCETMPADANIAIIPGLCRERTLIVDCDTMDAVIEFEDRFGKVERKTRTRRAYHLHCKSLPFRPPGNLRKYGIDADIKSGTGQYAVAPHSIHESGFEYAKEGDWSAPLVHIDVEAFHSFIHPPKPLLTEAPANKKPPRNRCANSEMTEGSRGLWVNKMWCANTDLLGSFDEALMMGFKANDWLGANHERGRLPEEEIISRCRQYWKDVEDGKLKRWGAGYRGVVKTQRAEIQRLKARGKGSMDAIALLNVLRDAHGGKSGEFQISATPMSKAIAMPRKRIEKARALLLQEGLIEKTRSARMTRKGPVAALFKLTS